MSSIADLCQGLVETEKSTIYPLVDRLIQLILTLHVSPKLKTICVNLHFDFNNQFIKATRTRPKFQKKKLQKKSFCFLLILRITRLYVRHSLDIKKIVFKKTLEWLGFYAIR
jgi:hypothetical protein